MAEVICQNEKHPKLLRLGIKDSFIPVGGYQYLLQQCGLDVAQIVQSIEEAL